MDLSLRFPLQWPLGWPRQPRRRDATFHTNRLLPLDHRLTVPLAIQRLSAELGRIHASAIALSSNLELRLDGSPRAYKQEPDDPGVVAYFRLNGRPTTLPCDTYTRVADNFAAIAAHIDATRAIARHGVGTLDLLFAGFQAIRGPESKKPWREVLGMAINDRPTRERITERRNYLARTNHSDLGGSDARMAEINVAVEEGLREIEEATRTRP